MKRFLRSGLVLAFAAAGFCMAPSAEGADEPHYFPPPESQGGWRTLVTRNSAPSPQQKAAVLRTAGLTLDPARGTIRGTPESPGAFPLTICVKDANGSVGIAKSTITVKPASNRNSNSK